jgi:hypothetical protein
MIPGLAPSTPLFQESSCLTKRPCSSSRVSSPKYQTLPCLSCAYQSAPGADDVAHDRALDPHDQLLPVGDELGVGLRGSAILGHALVDVLGAGLERQVGVIDPGDEVGGRSRGSRGRESAPGFRPRSSSTSPRRRTRHPKTLRPLRSRLPPESERGSCPRREPIVPCADEGSLKPGYVRPVASSARFESLTAPSPDSSRIASVMSDQVSSCTSCGCGAIIEVIGGAISWMKVVKSSGDCHSKVTSVARDRATLSDTGQRWRSSIDSSRPGPPLPGT